MTSEARPPQSEDEEPVNPVLSAEPLSESEVQAFDGPIVAGDVVEPAPEPEDVTELFIGHFEDLNGHAPRSIGAAKSRAEKGQKLADLIDLAKSKGKVVDASVEEDVRQFAADGINHWKLSRKERDDIHSYKTLPTDEKYKVMAALYLPHDTDVGVSRDEQRKRLATEIEARLRLDRQIRDREAIRRERREKQAANRAKGRPAEKTPEEVKPVVSETEPRADAKSEPEPVQIVTALPVPEPAIDPLPGADEPKPIAAVAADHDPVAATAGTDARGPLTNEQYEQAYRVNDTLQEFVRARSIDDVQKSLGEYTRAAAGREGLSVAIRKRYRRSNVEDLRERYEDARMDAVMDIEDRLWEQGIDKDEILMIQRLDDRTTARAVALGIKEESERRAAPKGAFVAGRQRFYDWWARQGQDKFFSRKGLAGRARRAGVMVGLGGAGGIAVGLAGAAVLGPAVGAAIGIGAARGVTRGVLAGRINRRANAMTVAGANYERRLKAQLEAIDDHYDTSDEVGEATAILADDVERTVRKNRIRLAASTALAAAFGAMGAELANLVHGSSPNLNNGGNGANSQPGFGGQEPDVPSGTHAHPNLRGNHAPATPETHAHPNLRGHHTPTSPETPPTESDFPPKVPKPRLPEHGQLGREFKVGRGSSFVREIEEYAEAHGYGHVDGGKAYRIYLALQADHGNHIIDLSGNGSDTYSMGGHNLGLSRPDAHAEWYPGVEVQLRELLDATPTHS